MLYPGLIPRLPEEPMPGAALAVSLLCHSWWWRDLSGKENLITNSYVYLLKKSLKTKAVVIAGHTMGGTRWTLKRKAAVIVSLCMDGTG